MLVGWYHAVVADMHQLAPVTRKARLVLERSLEADHSGVLMLGPIKPTLVSPGALQPCEWHGLSFSDWSAWVVR